MTPPFHRLMFVLSITLLASHGVGGCKAAAAGASVVEADDALLEFASQDGRGGWVSAPFSNSPWIPLGPGAEVTVKHGLSRTPVSAEVYVSSTPDDRSEANPRTFSAAAGDVANLRDFTADEVTVLNRTQGQFYIRLRLE